MQLKDVEAGLIWETVRDDEWRHTLQVTDAAGTVIARLDPRAFAAMMALLPAEIEEHRRERKALLKAALDARKAANGQISAAPPESAA